MNKENRLLHTEMLNVKTEEESKESFVGRMKQKSLLARVNTIETWGHAFAKGYGGLETDIFFRDGEFWIGHPPVPVADVRVDDFLAWLSHQDHQKIKVLLDVKNFGAWKRAGIIYKKLREFGVSDQVIVHAIFGGLKRNEQANVSHKLMTPNS